MHDIWQIGIAPRHRTFFLCTGLIVAAATMSGAPSSLTSLAAAHGGGLNAQGCHNDRRNGGYHCHRGSSSPAPRPQPVYSSPREKIYPNCDAARAAGAAPVYRGDPGYGSHLDRDGDGVGCENTAGGAQSARPPTPARSAIVALSTTPSTSEIPIPISGTAQVLDGDTIQIGLTRIRLFGVDAFEAEQMCKSSDGGNYGCGGRSTRALREKIVGESIVCVPKGKDAYDRQLAVCRAGSTDLASWMVRTGHAMAFTKYAYDYVSDEAHAKASRSGVWEGSFETPWDFRQTNGAGAAEAQRQSVAPSANCTIKGNVTRSGERNYHLPSDLSYVRTRAENWFCNIEEAERAGFKRIVNR